MSPSTTALEPLEQRRYSRTTARGAVRVSSRAKWGGHLLLSLVFAQIALGIATLVNVVPLPLAAMHQAGAVLVFAAALNVAHSLR